MHQLARTAKLDAALLPKKIGGFEFVREIQTDAQAQNYFFALYKNEAGAEALLKLWQKDACTNYAGTLISREISNYQSLAALASDIQGLSSKYAIYIPRLLESYVSNTVRWILLAYVPNTSNAEKFANVADYAQVREFIRNIGELPGARKAFLHRHSASFILGFLPMLFIASVLHQSFRSNFWKLVVGYGHAVVALLNKTHSVLCHLDIKPDNILINNGKRYIIDFQFLSYADPLYEVVFSWDRCYVVRQGSESFSAVIQTIVKGLRTTEKAAFSALVAYGLLFDLYIDREQTRELNLSAFAQLITHTV